MIQNIVPDWRRHFAVVAEDELSMDYVWEFMRRNVGYPYPNPFIIHSPEHEEYQELLNRESRRRNQKYIDLPDAPVIPFTASKRRLGQPVFKMRFETHHDINLRLGDSLIFIGSQLYYVAATYPLDGDYLLVVEDKDDNRFKVWYNRSQDIDLRTPEPQYINFECRPAYLYRPPIRQQKQGIGQTNISCRLVGDDKRINIGMRGIMAGLSTELHPWSPDYSKLMVEARALPALRLSKNIAFYTKKDKILAEYKGRALGEVNENAVTIDALDYKRPWITDHIRSIGCVPRVER